MDSLVSRISTVLEKYGITPDEPIVVGVSGWVDSMALLHALGHMHKPMAIHAVHVNHSLRWDESDGDAAFVTEYCKTNDIGLHVVNTDVAEVAKALGIGLEEAGRKVRQEAFAKLVDEMGARYVILAHHMDDSIETILFNFFRGSKLRGLSGMEELNGNILRPLLGIAKSEIRTYAQGHDIPFREDSSNASDEFLRNRIRNNIVPEIEAINPNFRENLLAFARYAKLAHAAHESEIMHFTERKEFAEEEFRKLSELAQNSLLEAVYRIANGTSVGLSEGNIAELKRFVLTANGGTKKELGKLLLTKKNRVISWSSSLENSR